MWESNLTFVMPPPAVGGCFPTEHVPAKDGHGIGRSALLALCVLVSEGLEPLGALEAANARRPLVSPSPAQYHAWIRWRGRRREAQAAPWSFPDFDAFKAVAHRHPRGGA